MQMGNITGLRQADVAFQANLYTDANATRRGLHLNRRHWVESALVLNLPPRAAAMEVGIGCGIFTRYLAGLGADVTAVDVNPAFLLAISGIQGVRPVLADATRPLAVEPQDLILCTEVLEHIPPEKSQAMLTSLHAALRDEGRLILTTPQSYSVVEILARLLRFRPFVALARKIYGTADELGHTNLLTARALKKQLRVAGFAIVNEYRYGFYLPIVAEVGGKAGWSILKAMEGPLARLPLLRNLLWTQAYVLKKQCINPAY